MLFAQSNYHLIQNCHTFVLALQLDRFKGFCLPYFHPRSNYLLLFCPKGGKKPKVQNLKIHKLQEKGNKSYVKEFIII